MASRSHGIPWVSLYCQNSTLSLPMLGRAARAGVLQRLKSSTHLRAFGADVRTLDWRMSRRTFPLPAYENEAIQIYHQSANLQACSVSKSIKWSPQHPRNALEVRHSTAPHTRKHLTWRFNKWRTCSRLSFFKLCRPAELMWCTKNTKTANVGSEWI
jgi:hypothetical protein